MGASPARLDGYEIDAVLVDAGGVLVDPNWATVTSVLARHGVAAAPDDLAAADPFLKRELDDAELVQGTTDIVRRERWLTRLLQLAEVRGDPKAIERATDELEAIHLERGNWEVVIAGATDGLDAMSRAGLRLSLASNAEPLLRGKLGELGLARYFEFLGISGELGVEKPDPTFFLRVLDALGVPPDRAAHVGDLYSVDVVGARQAGLTAILVDPNDLSSDRDVARVHDLGDVPALLGLS